MIARVGKLAGFAFGVVLIVAVSLAQNGGRVRPSDSGGALSAEQASYDVKTYDLALSVDPERRTIEGVLTVEALVVQPLRWLALDLDAALSVSSATWLNANSQTLNFERSATQVRIEFPQTRQPGDLVQVAIAYGGRPREAPRPPWAGGFVWAHSGDGRPWVAVACQLDGADLWWPAKDHPSDKPDHMRLHITVPAGLTVAANGTLDHVADTGDGRREFHWNIDNPISVYNVTLNIAPYREITGSYESVTGARIPLHFWVLPEDYGKGKELFRQFPRHLEFLERTIGPYPFQNEKYGVAETPYLGMEHQTVIAYGNHFQNNEYGFDALHLHELAHEWWGNLVTVTDWRDYWIHEGFASYMEALYAESLKGEEGLEGSMAAMRTRIRNRDPLAPRESRSTVTKYFAPPDYTQADGDVNSKGAWVLHTLRWLIGDQAFFASLRRFAYPPPKQDLSLSGPYLSGPYPPPKQDLSLSGPNAGEREAALGAGGEFLARGCACRFVSSEDFINTVESVTGRDLGWFFEVYLRRPELPRLLTRQTGEGLQLRWKAPDSLPFPMPVEVRIGDQTLRLDVPSEGSMLPLRDNPKIVVDPHHWILYDGSNP